MLPKNLKNFDLERTIKSVSIRKLAWTCVLGFGLFMIASAYEVLPLLLNRGTGRLYGLILLAISVYVSMENTRMAVSAETFTVNNDIYILDDILSVKAEVGHWSIMTALVIKMSNNETVRIICLTFHEDDARKFASLFGKLEVAKICSDSRKRGLE